MTETSDNPRRTDNSPTCRVCPICLSHGRRDDSETSIVDIQPRSLQQQQVEDEVEDQVEDEVEDQVEDRPIWVRGSCQHEFCAPCIKRVLTVPVSHSAFHDEFNRDSHLCAPTLGRCPICRAEMSLFDLTKSNSSTRCHDTTTHQATRSDRSIDSVPAFKKDTDIQNSHLRGMVFVQQNEWGLQIGKESLHFPRTSSNVSASAQTYLPYLDISQISDSFKSYWYLDNGHILPEKIYFHPGCHYHHSTRTFHGTILWDDFRSSRDKSFPENHENHDCRLFHGSGQWDFVLGFSSDFRWIARGVRIARKKQACSNPHYCTRYECKYPLDAAWKVEFQFDHDNLNNNDTHPSHQLNTCITTIHVQGNRFACDDQFSFYRSFYLLIHRQHQVQFPHPDHPILVWNPDSENKSIYTAASPVHCANFTNGPPDGLVIEWIRDKQVQQNQQRLSLPKTPSKMSWTLVSRTTEGTYSNPQVLEVIHFGPDDDRKKQYHRHAAYDNHRFGVNYPVPTYFPHSLIGNVFCQALTVGFASYHFVQHTFQAPHPPTTATTPTTTNQLGDDDSNPTHQTEWAAYISYDHEQVAQWPSLDNGEPVPSRIWFTDTSFDSNARIFRGTIDWHATHHTTWRGDRSWRYEMKFAENFSCIIGGTVSASSSSTFGAEDEQEVHTFGEQLVYINAGLLESLKSQARATATDEADINEIVDTYQQILLEFWASLRQELEARGDVSARTIDKLAYLWTFVATRMDLSYPS